jgi:hypothetical protein
MSVSHRFSSVSSSGKHRSPINTQYQPGPSQPGIDSQSDEPEIDRRELSDCDRLADALGDRLAEALGDALEGAGLEGRGELEEVGKLADALADTLDPLDDEDEPLGEAEPLPCELSPLALDIDVLGEADAEADTLPDPLTLADRLAEGD